MRRTGFVLAVGVIALAGCAGPPAATPPPSPGLSATASSSPASAPASSSPASSGSPSASSTAGSDAVPSARISMICTDKRVLAKVSALIGDTARTSSWNDRLFTCRYPAVGGALVITVKQPPKGGERTWYDQQRSRYPGITTIDGLTNFGLPGASTDDGVVLFLKDGMTLTVDARQLTDRPTGQRAQDAYSIASVVIACWQHDSF
ncbi:hypothetical protein [Tersicoccus phoenicis]|nr:hypothetical protein [Tersicoccus phoenicis]